MPHPPLLTHPRAVDPAGVSIGAGLYPVVRASFLRAPVAPRNLGVPVVPAPPPAAAPVQRGLRVRLSFG